MAEDRVERRLAAILAADVAGYSRLMGADEEGTLAALNAHRRALVDPKIAEHRGRIVKTTGDGLLVEFASVVDAVRAAVEIQSGMAARNEEVAEDRRIAFRIGINLGDVMLQSGDIFGDGVNVAARLEGLAAPGGICVSGVVHDQVRDKLTLSFANRGAQSLKNISRPVPVFELRLEAKSDQAAGGLSLPDKASIAVLPFQNMSGDPEQEYFADGIVEDITTALSRFHWFFVIARNSAFTYKGKAVDVREVGRALGVRYVLEGSVRKGGNRLRITAQLVEATTGNHLWAGKFDGDLTDVFDLQDKIAEGVVGAIEPSVQRAEVERARRKRPENLDAYDLYLRALPHAWASTAGDAAKALELLDRALQIDTSLAPAHALAAVGHYQRFVRGGMSSSDKTAAVRHARAVLATGTDDAVALAHAGFVLQLTEGDTATALRAVNRALEINPNSAQALARSAEVHAFSGQYEIGIELALRSLRLSPLDPMGHAPQLALTYAYYLKGEFAKAIEAAERTVQTNPRFVQGHVIIVASRMKLGQPNEAREAARRLMAIDPQFRFGFIRAVNFGTADQRNALAFALQKAGLPE